MSYFLIITGEPSVCFLEGVQPSALAGHRNRPAAFGFTEGYAMTQEQVSQALDYVTWRIEGETDKEQLAELAIVKEALESRIEA